MNQSFRHNLEVLDNQGLYGRILSNTFPLKFLLQVEILIEEGIVTQENEFEYRNKPLSLNFSENSECQASHAGNKIRNISIN